MGSGGRFLIRPLAKTIPMNPLPIKLSLIPSFSYQMGHIAAFHVDNRVELQNLKNAKYRISDTRIRSHNT
jgi:hypothetical protein